MTNQPVFDQFLVYKSLVHRNLKAMEGSIKDNLLNCLTISASYTFVFGYLLPVFGITQTLIGPLFLGGLIFISSLLSIFQIFEIAHDLATVKFNAYLFTLPINKWWVVAARVTTLIIELIAINIPVLILGKLILLEKLDFSNAHLPSFFSIYILGLLYFGTFAIMIAFSDSFAWIMKNAWPRRYLPLMFLGCIDTPWNMLAEHFPRLKYLYLLSPFTYLNEGYRTTLLGTETISIYLCLAAVALWIVVNIFIINWALTKKQAYI